ncbi:MAG TPA: aspartate--tRNA(Asn) ligase [Ktedonobacterales bacterium]|nr:aspartate--tRNA(Asn) ligase [Ktedonobacterales bacterium]
MAQIHQGTETTPDVVRVRTSDLAAHIGERAHVKGWLRGARRLGAISFLIVRDGWGEAQAVAESAAELAPLSDAGAGVESVVAITGTITAAPQAPGGVELRDISVEVITPVREAPPVTLSKRELKAGIGAQLDHAVLTNRHPQRRAAFQLAASAMAGFRETLTARSFTEIQTPKLVAAATEGGANVFEVSYFDRKAYLAQSPQFYKQVMVGVFERVFEVGPVFRAEPHETTRHLNEYVSLDAEFGFIEDHFTVMALLRDTLAGIFARMATERGAELALLGARLPDVPAVIPHIHFSDAQELILRLHGVDSRGEPDLAPQEERWLGEWALAEHDSEFLYVTGYPMAKRPFYTHPDLARPAYSNSFDLLFRGTELVTGGQRLHRYADYLAALERAGLSPEPFAWYLDAFRYGMPPEGGFAIGLERLIAQLTGAPNIKLVTLFPRDLTRLTP